MKSVFRTLLSLLLVVSLSATPVIAALAAGGSMGGEPASSTGSETFQTAGQKQGVVGVRGKLSFTAPCLADADDCICQDNANCRHFFAPISLALPVVWLAFMAVDFEPPVARFRENIAGLNFPPESRPPIA